MGGVCRRFQRTGGTLAKSGGNFSGEHMLLLLCEASALYCKYISLFNLFF